MELEINLPLLLPYLQEIKAIIHSNVGQAQKVVFSNPGMDAAGLQLLIALQKEFPHLALEITEGGYEIYTLQRAEEALKQLDAQKVDLIFTDLNMPGIDGLEFIRRLRGKNTGNRFTPIVMLTTESQQAKKEEARQAGATAWITKPFTAEELEHVIKKLLR